MGGGGDRLVGKLWGAGGEEEEKVGREGVSSG